MKETNINNSLLEATGEGNKAEDALKVFTDFWKGLPDNDKKKVTNEIADFVKTIKDSEAVQKFLSLGPIKETLASEALTEEDKDTLARKLKINRAILDDVDNVLSAISKICKLTPMAVGAIWDALELGPLDEILFAAVDGPVPVGDILAVFQCILSFIPDKLIISAIASLAVGGAEVVIRVLKDILIHKVIPEPKEVEEFKGALTKDDKPTELIESFAAQFKLYETLWD